MQKHGKRKRSKEDDSDPGPPKQARIDDDEPAPIDGDSKDASGIRYVGKAMRDKDKTDIESRATEFRIVYVCQGKTMVTIAIKKETLKSSELFTSKFADVPDLKEWAIPISVAGCNTSTLVHYFELLCLLEESTFLKLGQKDANFECEFYLQMGPEWATVQTLFLLSAYFGHAQMMNMAKEAWWYRAPWVLAKREVLDRKQLQRQLIEASELARGRFTKPEIVMLLGWMHWANEWTFSPPGHYASEIANSKKIEASDLHQDLQPLWDGAIEASIHNSTYRTVLELQKENDEKYDGMGPGAKLDDVKLRLPQFNGLAVWNVMECLAERGLVYSTVDDDTFRTTSDTTLVDAY